MGRRLSFESHLPSGVEVLRRNLLSFLKTTMDFTEWTNIVEPIWYSATSPAFDISIFEFLTPFLLKGELVIASDEAF